MCCGLCSTVKASRRVGLCPHVYPEACLCDRREATSHPRSTEHGSNSSFPGSLSPSPTRTLRKGATPDQALGASHTLQWSYIADIGWSCPWESLLFQCCTAIWRSPSHRTSLKDRCIQCMQSITPILCCSADATPCCIALSQQSSSLPRCYHACSFKAAYLK